MGVSGVFAHNALGGDANAISPAFTNPFNPSKKSHWLICPSYHAGKNLHFLLLLNKMILSFSSKT